MPANAQKSGIIGFGGMEFRICPTCQDAIHPIGFPVHVRRCTGVQRKQANRLLETSKVCPHCQAVMHRQSMKVHEPKCEKKQREKYGGTPEYEEWVKGSWAGPMVAPPQPKE